ncbi:MAG TPA: hypothetical protein VFQ42_12920, partial [Mycobacterium sp.]|nr:hypothetical protein [Mycobacterium sp.]
TPTAPVPEVELINQVEEIEGGEWTSCGSALPVLASSSGASTCIADVQQGRAVLIADPTILENGGLVGWSAIAL